MKSIYCIKPYEKHPRIILHVKAKMPLLSKISLWPQKTQTPGLRQQTVVLLEMGGDPIQ